MQSVERQELRGFDAYEVTLGDMLRGERATKGKSLLDVQRDLRIKAAYISAIENTDADVFPNPGFIAGYVRSYARYLELDPDEVYQQFCSGSGFGGVNSDLAGVRSKAEGRGKRARAGRPAGRAAMQDEVLKRSRLGSDNVAFDWNALEALSGLGSVAVLAALIAGLGYGGWFVLEELQRVRIAPVEQVPVVGAEATAIPLPEGPAAPGTDGTAAAEPALDIASLYAPQELSLPDFEPRDGPIAELDPERVGIYGAPERVATPAPGNPVANDMPVLPVAALTDADEMIAPLASPREVQVVAQQAAWVRVYLADGTVVFEKILDPGEAYTLPDELDAPLLRAGNSGAVFLLVGGETYGPLGDGPSVVKDVSLQVEAVRTEWPEVAADSAVSEALEEAVLQRSALTAD
ncbi:MAG: RodZ domain-containing protein [Pseudomonadota bacterium]